MIVELNASEFVRVAQIAKAHHDNKVRLRATERKYTTKLTGYELHLIGLLGELAVAKATLSKFRSETLDGNDGGYDLIVNGEPVQVKTFTYTGQNPEFYIDDMSQFLTETCYCCRFLSPCHIKVVGTIDRATFANFATEKDYGHGIRLCVPDRMLRPFTTNSSKDGG